MADLKQEVSSLNIGKENVTNERIRSKDFTIHRRRSMIHHPVIKNKWYYDVIFREGDVVHTADTEKEAKRWIKAQIKTNCLKKVRKKLCQKGGVTVEH